MWTDAIDLRDFYASHLGQVASGVIRNRVRAMWPNVKGQSVLGIGYAVPYLTPFRTEAARVVAAMPAPQGVLHWPSDGPSLTALTGAFELPFADLSFDRVLLVHALECAERTRPMMREIWRVLAGGGRLLVVVPNRRGLWARFERTPLAQGQPYSAGQLNRLLRDSLFTPIAMRAGLYIPPFKSRMLLKAAPAIERLGERCLAATFAGVVMGEATKQIYAGQPEIAVRRTAYVPAGGRPGAGRVINN